MTKKVFVEKRVESGLLGVFFEGKCIGTYHNIFSPEIQQYSGNENDIYDVDLASEFMRTKTDKELEIDRGWSTKEQQWFRIIAKR